MGYWAGASFVVLSSQNNTFLLPLVVLLFTAEGQSSFRRLPENVFHVLLIFRRALEVELCVHLLPGLLTLHPNTPRILPRGRRQTSGNTFLNAIKIKELLYFWFQRFLFLVTEKENVCALIVFSPGCRLSEPDSRPSASSYPPYPS